MGEQRGVFDLRHVQLYVGWWWCPHVETEDSNKRDPGNDKLRTVLAIHFQRWGEGVKATYPPPPSANRFTPSWSSIEHFCIILSYLYNYLHAYRVRMLYASEGPLLVWLPKQNNKHFDHKKSGFVLASPRGCYVQLKCDNLTQSITCLHHHDVTAAWSTVHNPHNQ